MPQLKRLLAALTRRQKIVIAASAAAVALAVFAFSYWREETGYRALYTALAPEDAGAVVQKLKQANVKFRLAENGTAVLVPSGRVSELRLQMAMDGLPKTGRMGFELFDKTNFGATDFAEQINYRRALEGELERSVGHIAEVEEARVHLTFPKDSVFVEARQPAKASVMLRLRPGAQLAAPSVQAICHLVASAVEGLAPGSVSVLDTRGNLLNRPRPADEELQATEAHLEYRQNVERDLMRKIRATLEPLLGAGRFQTGVSVDCDFSSGEQSEESYDPARVVALTSQKSEDSMPAATTAGVPGTASNLPRPTSTPSAASTGMHRRMENVTFQPSRTVRRVRQAQGTIKRLSVALLVDQDVRWEGPPTAPRRVLLPPSPGKLKSIRDLVAGTISFDQTRGDQLVVESLPFEATLKQAPPPAPPAPVPGKPPFRLPGDPRLWLLGGAGAGLLTVLGGTAWWMVRRRVRRRGAANIPHALPQGEESQAPSEISLEERLESELAQQEANRDRLDEATLEAIRGMPVRTQKSDVLARHLKEQIGKDSDSCAQILRSWLNSKD